MVLLDLLNTYSWFYVNFYCKDCCFFQKHSCFIFLTPHHYTGLKAVIWYFGSYAHHISIPSNTYCFFCSEMVKISSSYLEVENTLLPTIIIIIALLCNRTPGLAAVKSNFIPLNQSFPTSPDPTVSSICWLLSYCLHLQDCLFPLPYMSKIMGVVSFCTWLISLG